MGFRVELVFAGDGVFGVSVSVFLVPFLEQPSVHPFFSCFFPPLLSQFTLSCIGALGNAFLHAPSATPQKHLPRPHPSHDPMC